MLAFQQPGSMEFLHSDIGSAKDNSKSPIHNWYKFTAGYSHRFVDEIILLENLKRKKNSQIFDPFAGCGTTLVSSQKVGISAVGNEAQEFMYDVIRAKLNWKLEGSEVKNYLQFIKEEMTEGVADFDKENTPHKLLKTLYTEQTLSKLYLIKKSILSISSLKYKLFFKLALSQTLHKVSIHPIAVPYISRNKTLTHTDEPWEFFESITRQMFTDTIEHFDKKKTSKIFLHDSRIPNKRIEDGECNMCITSPPYLNNLDYGEVSKVHTHFFEITDNWNDITQKVRHKLVTGATTHYSDSEFLIDEFRKSEFYLSNKIIAEELIATSITIKSAAEQKSGKKSFDILTLLYFQDMFDVLNEIRRVVRSRNNAYLILGDSAPYGIYVPTTEILGRISQNIGFSSFNIHKIRTRGTKWKTLKHRHSLELSENVLVLK
ncbi:MAG: methyltransferase [Bacteroidetes bacterium]|nr:methyltransferase [Bacteroidota bacterium]